MHISDLILRLRALHTKNEPLQQRVLALQSLLSQELQADLLNRDSENSNDQPYSRILLNHPDDPFQVIAAFWPAGKSSPIHDHDGLFGAVCCLKGLVEERRYQQTAITNELKQLECTLKTPLKPGQTAVILTPKNGEQIHSMNNPGREPAVTLHVYCQKLENFQIYQPEQASGYRCFPQKLWLDAYSSEL